MTTTLAFVLILAASPQQAGGGGQTQTQTQTQTFGARAAGRVAAGVKKGTGVIRW
jgi:hypothetical protein